MIADSIFCLLFLLAAGGGIYLLNALLHLGQGFGRVLAQMSRARLKALARRDLTEAEQIDLILSLVKTEEEPGRGAIYRAPARAPDCTRD